MMNGVDISRLNDKRLAAFKKTLYKERNRWAPKCDCCGEEQIIDVDMHKKACEDIRLVSIEQMSRKENQNGNGSSKTRK